MPQEISIFYIGFDMTKSVFGVADFACSKLRYDTFQKANNKGADQPAPMHKLIYTFVVRKHQTCFLTLGPIYYQGSKTSDNAQATQTCWLISAVVVHI